VRSSKRAAAREIGEVWRRLVGGDYPAMAGIGMGTLACVFHEM
jgi:hypothetical protein